MALYLPSRDTSARDGQMTNGGGSRAHAQQFQAHECCICVYQGWSTLHLERQPGSVVWIKKRLHTANPRKKGYRSINVLAAGPALGGEDTTGSKLPQQHLVETGGVQGVPEQTVRQGGAGTSGTRPCTTVFCYAVPTTSDNHVSSIPFCYCPMITGGAIDQDVYPSPSPCPMIAPPTPASLGDGANQRSHSAGSVSREESIALIDNTPLRG